jgi:hypothetical protein
MSNEIQMNAQYFHRKFSINFLHIQEFVVQLNFHLNFFFVEMLLKLKLLKVISNLFKPINSIHDCMPLI